MPTVYKFVFDRPYIYGPPDHSYPDNLERFTFLSRGALELCKALGFTPDIVHANDWQAALVPAYLAWNGSSIPTILTIHNLAYQGLFSKESLRRIGAPADSFHIDCLEFYDKLSFLKGGIVYASHLTTVSETYAREITTSEFGCGLEGLLRRRSSCGQGAANWPAWTLNRFCARVISASTSAPKSLSRRSWAWRITSTSAPMSWFA